MDAELLIARLEQTLAEEREAIRRLDGAAVERFADDKRRIVDLLLANAPRDARTMMRLRRAAADIRRNGVLLANARDCVRDALVAARVAVAPVTRPSSPPQARTGAHLSVTG